MREWPVRGLQDACVGDNDLAEACIRANKDDEHGTMGFFLAGFVRDQEPRQNLGANFLRDERGHMVRDLMGYPVEALPENSSGEVEEAMDDEEWGGFEEEQHSQEVLPPKGVTASKTTAPKTTTGGSDKRHHPATKKRPLLGIKQEKKRKRAKA